MLLEAYKDEVRVRSSPLGSLLEHKVEHSVRLGHDAGKRQAMLGEDLSDSRARVQDLLYRSAQELGRFSGVRLGSDSGGWSCVFLGSALATAGLVHAVITGLCRRGRCSGGRCISGRCIGGRLPRRLCSCSLRLVRGLVRVRPVRHLLA